MPQGRSVAQRQNQAADARPQGEPPGGHAVVKGQLGGANGGLAADQGSHDGATDDPSAGLAAAAGKIRRRADLPPGIDAHADDQSDGGQQAHHVPGGQMHVGSLLFSQRVQKSRQWVRLHKRTPICRLSNRAWGRGKSALFRSKQRNSCTPFVQKQDSTWNLFCQVLLGTFLRLDFSPGLC